MSLSLLTIFSDLICSLVWLACPFLIFKLKRDSIISIIFTIIISILFISVGVVSRLNEELYDNPLKSVISMTLLFLFYLCFDAKISHKIISFLAFFVSFALGELIGVGICLLLNINYKDESIPRLLILLAILFIQYLFFTIYRQIYNKIANQVKLSINIIYFYLIIIFEICTILTITYTIYLNPKFTTATFINNIHLIIMTIITFITMIAANIGLYKIFIDNTENFELKRELETANLRNQLEVNYYNKLQDNINETNKLNHDMTNLITSIKLLIETYDVTSIANAKKISNELLKRLKETKTKRYCQNEFINLILINKSKEIEKENIEFTTNLDFPNNVKFSNADLCSVFSNILDNAKDACIKAKDKTKTFITLDTICKKNYLTIKCSNYCDTELNIINNRIKTTKKDHEGLGLEIINSISHKYGGYCTTNFNDNIFTIKLVLNDILNV